MSFRVGAIRFGAASAPGAKTQLDLHDEDAVDRLRRHLVHERIVKCRFSLLVYFFIYSPSFPFILHIRWIRYCAREKKKKIKTNEFKMT